ncbi:MAG: hypothetical protein WBR21_08195, partial [Rouxiella badensis]
MAGRYDTNSEVPSNALPDLNDNMLVFDAFVNQETGTVTSRKGIEIPVLQEQVSGRIDALTETAQTALTGAQASASEAKDAAAASSVLIDNLADSPGGGLVGYSPGNNYAYGTVGDKLNRWVDIRDFKDTQAEGGDWSNAIEAAIKYGIENEIHDVRGTGNFYTSRTITLEGMAGSFKVSIDKLGITKDFPNTATSIFGTATDMIRLGTTGNMNGLELYIGTLDGAYQTTTAGVASFDVSVPRTPVANGLVQYGGGLTSSYTTMGYLQNCVVGLLWGDQTSPTGTIFFKIGYVHYNYIGAYIRSGSSGSAPIAEANVFDFRFCAQNYICGVWGGHGGQFTTLQNGNYDYNGQHCAR